MVLVLLRNRPTGVISIIVIVPDVLDNTVDLSTLDFFRLSTINLKSNEMFLI